MALQVLNFQLHMSESRAFMYFRPIFFEVKSFMSRRIHNYKILDSIIELIKVFMMDLLIILKEPFKMLFHNVSVLVNSAFSNCNKFIARWSNASSSLGSPHRDEGSSPSVFFHVVNRTKSFCKMLSSASSKFALSPKSRTFSHGDYLNISNNLCKGY
jgi:hypothetical protein